MNTVSAFILALLISMATGGCASLPTVFPGTEAADLEAYDRVLERVFPSGSFQFVHSLELGLPGNHSAMLIGVLNINSLNRSVHCVLMTLEGLVLFEADSGAGGLFIERSIPPFDSREMVNGLVRDIRLIFFRPQGKLLAAGYLEDSRRIFRFSADKETIDLISDNSPETWTLNAHDSNKNLLKRIVYRFTDPAPGDGADSFPASITLTAPGLSGYTLTMTLLDTHLIDTPIRSGD